MYLLKLLDIIQSDQNLNLSFVFMEIKFWDKLDQTSKAWMKSYKKWSNWVKKQMQITWVLTKDGVHMELVSKNTISRF